MIIAIDGPAASGKGTLARGLAKSLDFAHLDSGLFYRLYPDLHDVIKTKSVDEGATILADAFRLANLDSVRDENHAKKAALFAQEQRTRNIVNRALKKYAKEAECDKGGIVVDGRDIGTLVFPGADVKLFVTATILARSKRRFKELENNSKDISLESIIDDIKNRDERDQNRQIAPLKPAFDSVVLDTTGLDVDETLKNALAIVERVRKTA